jgi:tetratricopeptide (TPR) repeat protein
LETAASRDEQLALQLAYLLIRYGLTDAAKEHTDKIAARIAPEGHQPDAPVKPDRRVGEVYFLQGLVAAGQDRKTNALAFLQSADKHDFPPRDSYQMLILADALYQLQETRLASQAYQEYLKYHAQDVDARFRLGLTYYASGALDAAQTAFEQVRTVNPLYPEVNYQLAEILFSKNNLDDAEKTLRAEMERNPRCGPCLAKLARIQHQRGEAEQAEKSLEEARKLAPDWSETHLVAGLLASRKGNYEEAIRELEIVAAKLPGFATAHLQLSIAFSRAGRAEKAKEHRDIYNRLIQEQKDAVSSAVKDERKPRP